MDLRLSGQVAVVTGASKGIGLAITRALAGEGVHVVAGARDTSAELEQLVGGGYVEAVMVDLSTADAPAALVERATAIRRLDILINNVGAAATRPSGFLEVTDDQWLSSLTLNLLAAVRTTRAALPTMLAAGHGAVVTIASVNAYLPDPLVIDYSAANAALASFSKSLSKEVGPHGIRSTRSAPDRSRRTCGWGLPGSPSPSPAQADATPTTSRQQQPAPA